MSRKRVLISGSAGFIFSNFIRYAVYTKSQHNYEFYSVDKIANSSMINNIYQNKLHEFYLADICDEHIMTKIFEYIKPEIVINGAAESAVDKSINNANPFITSNVLGTQILVNLSVKYNVEKFVQISTDEIYGSLSSSSDLLWTEEAPSNPLNPYSASKAAAEMIVKAAANTFKLPYIITRSSNNYGARQTSDKLIPRILKSIFNNQPIPIYGEGKQIRDWLHVQDNCSAILLLLRDEAMNSIYNISANQEYSNIQVVNMVCDIIGAGHSLITHIPDPRPGHDFRYGINSSKIRNLGWSPAFKSFKEGLTQCITWFNDNSYFLKI